MKVFCQGGIEACSERRWYALRNFHMQYYEDSHVLNEYVHFWRDSLQDYWKVVADDMPASMKLVAWLCRHVPAFRKQVERTTYGMMRGMAENHRNGTAYWHSRRNDMRISAFFKDYATYEAIPDWGVDMPQLDPDPEWRRLDHGYDESKPVLDLSDLHGAARFRGGQCARGLFNHFECLRERHGAIAADARFERFAFDQLHDIETLTVLLAVMTDARDIRVADLRGRACFAQEARSRPGILCDSSVDYFKRDGGIQHCVARAISYRHCSGAELDRKAVRADFHFKVIVLQRPRCQSSAVLDFVRLLAIA